MARTPARRFLAAQGRSGNGHGYSTQPQREYPVVADEPDVVERIRDATNICDEPESESGAWLDATADRAFMVNQQARIADIAQAQGMRPLLSMEQRMADAQRRAKMQHVDCRSEFTALRRMLDTAKTESDKRRARTEAAAERRLQRVESKLDQLPGELAA